LRSLKSAIAAAVLLFPLVNACESASHQFANSGGSGGDMLATGGATGGASGGSSAGTEAAHGGASPIETGGTAPAAGAPTSGAGAGGAEEAGGAGGQPSPVAECQTGQQESCWKLEDGTPLPGPMPSAEIGSCHIGKRFCGEASQWGPCLGAVGAKTSDSCDVAGNDDDCDTVPNHGCNCVNGTKRSCGTDVGSCKSGQQTCVAQAWGPCVGEVTKQALDSCLTAGNDDNCDGTPNENCPCIGNASESCNGCGSRSCNPANRQWGACQAAKPSECSSATQVRDCSPDGDWVTTTCKYACAGGSCTGTCVPDDTRCVTGPERRQACNAQGAWATIETCANGKLCQDDGGSCVAPCAGQKLCPGNMCVPLGGCCSDADCGNNFACVNGSCSTTTCQSGFNGPCGGACTKGCCSVNDCPDHPNMGRSCNGSHQCLYACKPNYGNCDGSDANGCEVDLIVGTTSGFSIKDCGSCGNTCDFINPGGTDCTTLANSCAQAECLASFKPVGDPTDQSAYKCPVDRPHATLLHGDCDIGCSYNCAPGYTDCDYGASNGCETPSDVEAGDCYKTPFWGGTF
jgi:hypothetical protein